jgi:N-acetylglucosamine-6-phosphate deacetylase
MEAVSPLRGRWDGFLAGARVVTPAGILDGAVVRVAEGRIAAVVEGPPPAGETALDLSGRWLVPGFVDQHVHGGGGASYPSGDPGEARGAAAFHRRHGTTTTVASLVSAAPAALEAALRSLAPLVRAGELAGVHLEGPYISAARRGAHDPFALRAPDPAELEALLDAGQGCVRMVTVAPELAGARELIRVTLAAGAVAAIGHTDASYGQARAAIDAGATVATHLFNGMAPLHHRSPGPVAAALEDERVTVELICDGVHLHPAAARLAFAHAGARRVALITDAIAAAGMPDGRYTLGTMAVQVSGGVARLADGDAIAGSTLTLDHALRHAVTALGVPLADAVVAAAVTPARVLGVDGRTGSIEAGKDADLVVLDDAPAVVAVMARGEWIDPG